MIVNNYLAEIEFRIQFFHPVARLARITQSSLNCNCQTCKEQNKMFFSGQACLICCLVFEVSFYFIHGSRFPSKASYSNPYAGEEQGWRGRRDDQFYSSGRAGGGDDALGRAPWGGWRGDAWGAGNHIPMGLMPARHPNPAMQQDTSGECATLVCLCNTYTQSANSFV